MVKIPLPGGSPPVSQVDHRGMQALRFRARRQLTAAAGLKCAFCGRILEPCLERLGSIACHDCRDDRAEIRNVA
jgi:hypothetical protein